VHPPGADTVVVRHGDVGVKSSQVQSAMERRLRANVAAMLETRGVPGEVERQWSRILVRTDEGSVEDATDAATDVFGVISASPAVSVPPEFDAIRDTLAETARGVYDEGAFAVRARRAGKPEDHPFASSEIERDGGAAVWEAVEDRFDPEVDLDDPDVTFYVEVRQEEAFVFLEKRPGPGGLPLGTQGKVVTLVSGGIDSPVAAWEMMKRGCKIVPVYLDLGDYGGPDHEARAIETVRELARYAPGHDLRVRKVPVGEEMDLLVESVGKTRMLSFRRFMFRLAEHVARAEGAEGIVTGEAVGQKSSQTTANLAVTSRATDLPIYRPLLTLDKHEITERARTIGTYVSSTIPAGCNRIAPGFPETNATLEKVLDDEPGDLFERAKEAAERVELVEVEPARPSPDPS
jgi:thiamine biosynthesis protein ThiI